MKLESAGLSQAWTDPGASNASEFVLILCIDFNLSDSFSSEWHLFSWVQQLFFARSFNKTPGNRRRNLLPARHPPSSGAIGRRKESGCHYGFDVKIKRCYFKVSGM